MIIPAIVRQNAPSMLTGMALGGLVETAIFTVDATIKAVRVCDEKGIDMREHPIQALDETRSLWIRPLVTLLGTGACVLGVYSSLSSEIAGLAAVCSVAESRYSKRVTGEHAPVPSTPAADGMMWCYEPESDQYFQATPESILHAELVANKMFANRGELRFNDYLDLLPGCKHVPWGDHFGWFKYDDEGYWDYNWSFYPGATPWIDIQPCVIPDKGILVIKYGMHPGDDMDCKDALEEPEQFIEKEVLADGTVIGKF